MLAFCGCSTQFVEKPTSLPQSLVVYPSRMLCILFVQNFMLSPFHIESLLHVITVLAMVIRPFSPSLRRETGFHEVKIRL